VEKWGASLQEVIPMRVNRGERHALMPLYFCSRAGFTLFGHMRVVGSGWKEMAGVVMRTTLMTERFMRVLSGRFGLWIWGERDLERAWVMAGADVVELC
jgi:hypothetical protein